MAYPTMSFQWSPATDPLAAPTWVDIPADRVRSYSFRYGKQAALDQFQAGSLSMVLDNHDRLFDPLYAAGTYYGQLKPRKRMRARATYAGVTYDLFTVFVDGWGPQTFQPPADAVTSITGTDLFILLQNIELPPSLYEKEVTDDNPFSWWRWEETTGESIKDSSGNGHDGVYNSTDAQTMTGPPLPTFGSTAGIQRLQNTANDLTVGLITGPDALIPGFPFTFETWISMLPTSGAAGVTAPFAQQNYGGIHFDVYVDSHLANNGYIIFTAYSGTNVAINDLTCSTAPSLTNSSHHLVIVVTAANTATVYVDGVAQSTSVGGSYTPSAGSSSSNIRQFQALGGFFDNTTSGLTLSGKMDETALYLSALSAGRILAHYQAGVAPWSGDTSGARINRILDYAGIIAGDRNIDTGIAILGDADLGGDALGFCRAVETTEFGSFYVEHRNAGKLTFLDRFKQFTASRSITAQAVFSDDPANGTAIRYEPDDLSLNDDESTIVNEAVVKWDGGEVRVTDATSITTHGRKSKSFDTRLKTSAEAQSYGEWIVALFKNSFVRVDSVSLNPAGNNAAWPAALGLRFLDRVTFRLKPQDFGTAIQTDYLIQGVNITAANGVADCRVTFNLIPAALQANLGLWDSGLWDTATWVM